MVEFLVPFPDFLGFWFSRGVEMEGCVVEYLEACSVFKVLLGDLRDSVEDLEDSEGGSIGLGVVDY